MTKDLLFEFTLADGCRHHIAVWVEEFADGTWTLHGSGPCAACQAWLTAAFREALPDVPLWVVES